MALSQGRFDVFHEAHPTYALRRTSGHQAWSRHAGRDGGHAADSLGDAIRGVLVASVRRKTADWQVCVCPRPDRSAGIEANAIGAGSREQAGLRVQCTVRVIEGRGARIAGPFLVRCVIIEWDLDHRHPHVPAAGGVSAMNRGRILGLGLLVSAGRPCRSGPAHSRSPAGPLQSDPPRSTALPDGGQADLTPPLQVHRAPG